MSDQAPAVRVSEYALLRVRVEVAVIDELPDCVAVVVCVDDCVDVTLAVCVGVLVRDAVGVLLVVDVDVHVDVRVLVGDTVFVPAGATLRVWRAVRNRVSTT